MMKPIVLWVEDNAIVDLANLLAPIYNQRKVDIRIAFNASEAIEKLSTEPFDATIVDIRIPPGDSQPWQNLYNRSNGNKATARLGLHLLHTLLNSGQSAVKLSEIPDWICSERIGVLTVESEAELREDLEELGIKHYKQKKADMPVTALVDIINSILDNRRPVGNGT